MEYRLWCNQSLRGCPILAGRAGIETRADPWIAHRIRDESDFSEVKGQYHVRRAVEVAAARLARAKSPSAAKQAEPASTPTTKPEPQPVDDVKQLKAKLHNLRGMLEMITDPRSIVNQQRLLAEIEAIQALAAKL